MLFALPVFLMSLFIAPASVVKKLERIFRNFLWNDKENLHRAHLVGWEVVNCPKDKGGLGIKQLHYFNIALIMKWLWRFGCERDALWRIIVAENNGEDILGWFPKFPKSACGCSVWKGISNFLELFISNYKLQVGNGALTSFWGDTWLAPMPLKVQFPSVFAAANNKEKIVAEVRSGVVGAFE